MKKIILMLLMIAILVLFASSVYAYDGTCCDSVGSGCYKNGVTGIAAGYYHTCFFLSDGNVTCQGSNLYGQSLDYTLGDVIGVAAGRYHTCFLLSDGNVTCQGYNANSLASDYIGGDAVGVAGGYGHTCFLLSDGDVTCQGGNVYGESNDYTGGDAVGVAAGGYHTCFLLSDGNVTCQGYNGLSQSNDYTGGDAVGVAAGMFYTCFLLSDGNVTCQGQNTDGQSNNYTSGDAVGVATGDYHACFLLSDGDVTCQGQNTDGQSNDYTGGDAVGVAAGRYHTCFLLSDGDVTCQGQNTDGQSNDYTEGNAVCSRDLCIDLDNDGYGNPGNVNCLNGSQTDCNDSNANIYPGTTETCDNLDNDCDGTIDEGCVTVPTLAEGITLYDDAENPLSSDATTHTSQTNLYFKKDGIKKVEVPITGKVNFDAAIHLDSSSTKVVVDFGSSTGLAATHTLYVPVGASSSVYVCPNALTMVDVKPSCANAVSFSYSQCSSSTTKNSITCDIDGTDYKLSGLTGTGAAQGSLTNLTVWDETDSGMPYADKTIYALQEMLFFANFTNATGPANTTDGACRIQFDTGAGYGSFNDMAYNSTYELYTYNNSFPAAGTFDFNVSCDSQGEVLDADDQFTISSIDIPEFSTVTLGLGLIAVLGGLFIIRRKK